MKNIYFIRHGESEGNYSNMYQSVDTGLSEQGHIQAQAMANRFKNIEVDSIISSTYTRAEQTASYISQAIHLPVIESELFVERKRPSIQENRSKDELELQNIDKEIEVNWGGLGDIQMKKILKI